MRSIKHLNNNWLFKPNFTEADLEELTNGVSANIPHTLGTTPYNYVDEEGFTLSGYYEKKIMIPKGAEDERVLIGFEGIVGYAKVYVNGNFAGEHRGLTPFEVNITGLIHHSQPNKIGVVIEVEGEKGCLPFGGIVREVYLKHVPNIHIQEVFVHTEEVLAEEKQLRAEINLSKLDQGMSLQCTVINEEGRVVRTLVTQYLNEVPASVQMPIQDIKLWDIENPYLYTLNVILLQSGQIIDEVTVPFGFREVSFKSDGFYLNGKKIKLRGLNRIENFESVGYAMPRSIQAKDALILKRELGLNVVRVSKEIPSKHFLNKCDEIGLLVFEELPNTKVIKDDVNGEQVALQTLEAAIKRDRNHPSVVTWLMPTRLLEVSESFSELTEALINKLDLTRPVSNIRDLEGVYFLDEFYKHHTKSFDGSEKRLKQALYHVEALDELYKGDNTIGSLEGEMCDYHIPKVFGNGDNMSYRGVLDLYRNPKIAAYTYMAQQEEIPFLEALFMTEQNNSLGSQLGEAYIFTNCDFIKCYKNETFIGDFYPDRQEYAYIMHPPIVINDYLGNQLEVQDGYTAREAQIIKKILKELDTYGEQLPLKTKAQFAYTTMKHGLTIEDIKVLYAKYLDDYDKNNTYLFEGYKDGKLVKHLVKSSKVKPRIVAEADCHQLVINETYDVTRIVVKAVDQHDNLLPFLNDVIYIQTKGAIEVIGSKCKPLIGGTVGIYIRTVGESGTASVTINSDYLGGGRLLFEIERNTDL